jgi:hypothetical protein
MKFVQSPAQYEYDLASTSLLSTVTQINQRNTNLEGNKHATNVEISRICRYVFVGFNYFLQHSLFGLSAPDGELYCAEAKVDL